MGPRPAQISSVLEMLGYQTKWTELNLQHMEITWVFSKYTWEWHSKVLTEAHKSPSYCWLAQVITSYSVSASKILLLHRCSTVYVHRCVLAVIKRNYMAGFCWGPFKRWSKIDLHWQKSWVVGLPQPLLTSRAESWHPFRSKIINHFKPTRLLDWLPRNLWMCFS